MQWRQAKPPGMRTRDFERVARCWRKRGRSDPLLPASALPPTAGLRLRMGADWLRDTLFLHAGNVGRLGKGFADEGGTTLSDTAEVLPFLPADGEQVRHPHVPLPVPRAPRAQRAIPHLTRSKHNAPCDRAAHSYR